MLAPPYTLRTRGTGVDPDRDVNLVNCIRSAACSPQPLVPDLTYLDATTAEHIQQLAQNAENDTAEDWLALAKICTISGIFPAADLSYRRAAELETRLEFVGSVSTDATAWADRRTPSRRTLSQDRSQLQSSVGGYGTPI
ncbi:MAG: hypothetical protein CMJ64_18660 [Planctomycetaceae bacterium]|nr:hypothetical protein [Planctomycetaceae bacterium]